MGSLQPLVHGNGFFRQISPLFAFPFPIERQFVGKTQFNTLLLQTGISPGLDSVQIERQSPIDRVKTDDIGPICNEAPAVCVLFVCWV